MIRIVAAAIVALVAGAGCAPEDAQVGGEGRPNVVCEGCSAGGVVEFGTPLVGERIDRVVTLRNRGDGPALLRQIQASAVPPGFTVGPSCTSSCGVHELAPGGALELAITFRPTTEGRAETLLALGPDGPDLRLVGQGGRIACAALDFGGVVRGQQRSLALECENTTDGDRQISFGAAIGEHAGEFQVETTTLELAALGRASTAVAFAPADMAGPRDVRLPILVGADRVGEVELRGTAVDGVLDVPAAGAACVEWGFQLPGTRHVQAIEVMNVTHEAVPVGLRFGPGSDPAFSTSHDTLRLEPGERALVAVAFEPQEAGAAAADLLIESGDEVHRVCARGTGVGPTLSCDRGAIDFGLAAIGMPRTTRLRCTNAAEEVVGTELDRLVIEGTTSAEFMVVQPVGHPAAGYAPGEAFELEVRYAAPTTGVHTAAITTNDHRGTIPLQGEARSYPDCTLEAATSYDFGRVAGDTARHPFFLTNTGSGPCLVGDFVVTQGEGFSAAPPFGSFEIGPGATAAAELEFDAGGAGEGAARGELAFWTSDSAGWQRRVALEAHVGPSCLDPHPAHLELEAAEPMCTGQPEALRLRNTCGGPITILSVELVQDATHPFQLVEPAVMPATLDAWRMETLEVYARAAGTGTTHGAIRVTTDAFPEPIVIPLHASVDRQWSGSDTHVLEAPPVDILFVIEDSQADHLEYILLADAFFAGLDGVDWQLGVTTTSVGPGHPSGRLVPVDGSSPRIISPALSPAVRDAAFYANLAVGIQGSATEQPLEAMRLALAAPLTEIADDPATPEPNDGNRGFLRRDADLAVIFFIEEDDRSPASHVEYLHFLEGLKLDGQSVRLHLVPQTYGLVPNQVAQAVLATGGTIVDVMDYQATPAFSQAIAAMAAPEGPRPCIPLRYDPALDTLSLQLNGLELPGDDEFYPWEIRRGPGSNELCFTGATPQVGGTLTIAYEKLCH